MQEVLFWHEQGQQCRTEMIAVYVEKRYTMTYSNCGLIINIKHCNRKNELDILVIMKFDESE